MENCWESLEDLQTHFGAQGSAGGNSALRAPHSAHLGTPRHISALVPLLLTKVHVLQASQTRLDRLVLCLLLDKPISSQPCVQLCPSHSRAEGGHRGGRACSDSSMLALDSAKGFKDSFLKSADARMRCAFCMAGQSVLRDGVLSKRQPFSNRLTSCLRRIIYA